MPRAPIHADLWHATLQNVKGRGFQALCHVVNRINCIDNDNTPARIQVVDVQFKLRGESFIRDSEKALQNERKHGIRFDEAAGVFFDPLFIIVDASRNAEARNAAIGFDVSGRLMYVVHVGFEENCIRIISARRATAGEERDYAQ